MGILLSTTQPEPEHKSEAQFAMESSCFCVICGSPFGPEGESYNLDAGAIRYEVYPEYQGDRLIDSPRSVDAKTSLARQHARCSSPQSYRLVKRRIPVDESIPKTLPVLTDVATWTETNDQLFHIDAVNPERGTVENLTFNPMQQVSDYDTVFPLHENCLQIGCQVIDHLTPYATKDHYLSRLSLLNEILQARYRNNTRCTKDRSLIARNDILDLCTATDTNDPQSVVALSLLEWWAGEYENFYTDPVKVPNLTTCVLRMLQETTASKPYKCHFAQPSQATSGLERLPFELLVQISVHLPAHSALALHLTSKTLASKVPLDNNFWRMGFLNKTVLPYLWDLDVEELDKCHQEHFIGSSGPIASWDWKGVGQLLAKRKFPLKSSEPQIANLPAGLWNRRRIWSIVERAYILHFSKVAIENQDESVGVARTRREPVFDWQLEEIMDDLGHYS